MIIDDGIVNWAGDRAHDRLTRAIGQEVIFPARSTPNWQVISYPSALPGVRLFDLLDSPTYLALSRNPERIAEEQKFKSLVCVSLAARKRKAGAVWNLPYQEFLSMLWENEFSRLA